MGEPSLIVFLPELFSRHEWGMILQHLAPSLQGVFRTSKYCIIQKQMPAQTNLSFMIIFKRLYKPCLFPSHSSHPCF